MLTYIANIFRKIGFWLGSSRWLAQSLVRYAQIDSTKPLKILELGAWYGNVTREIMKNLSQNASLIALECDINRIHALEQIEHPNIRIIHGDAQNIHEYCENESIDIVISTLPLGSFDSAEVEGILKEVQLALKKWGTYIQYQYWMANRKDVKRYFHINAIKLEPRNFTPAFIYLSYKP